MKIIKYTAPIWSEADTYYCEENNWHHVLTTFESHVDEMEVGDKLNFQVEILEMTEKEWEDLQVDFIEG